MGLLAKKKSGKWLTADGLILITGWARDGLTDVQIAKNMGISVTTLYCYKNDFPLISEALRQGKEVVDMQVENMLFKNAMGYEFKEVTFELVEATVIDPETYVMETVPGTKIKTVIKQQPPNVTAQIFWLKNRKPVEWRDKVQNEITGKDGGVIEIDSPRERIASRMSSLASRIATNKVDGGSDK